jgi:hypothetical protein
MINPRNRAFCRVAAFGDFAAQSEGNLASAALSGGRGVGYPAISLRAKRAVANLVEHA